MHIKFTGLLMVAAGLVVQPAYAADIPLKAPAVRPAAPYNWSGCYVGIQAGYGWARDEADETVTGTGAPSIFSPAETGSPSGALAGGMLGCNWQGGGPLVVGVEADVEWSDIGGSAVSYPLTGVPPDTYEASIRSQASLRGRIGYAFDRALFYVTGGVAFANIRHDYTTAGLPSEEFSTTRTGWALGAGAEYAFAANWSMRAEYRYADFGTVTNIPVVVWAGFTESHRITEHAVRLGVTYRFF